MAEIADTLSQDFRRQFEAEGFVEVGAFGLDDSGRFCCQLGDSYVLAANFSLYAFVGFSGGGVVLRIGESGERPIAKRILEYPRYINDACDKRLGSNGYFAGGTKPWERDGWFDYLRLYRTGLIFGKVLDFSRDAGARRGILHSTQNALIAKYAPPFCNDSSGSKPLKTVWEQIHGKAQKHFKRQRNLT